MQISNICKKFQTKNFSQTYELANIENMNLNPTISIIKNL